MTPLKTFKFDILYRPQSYDIDQTPPSNFRLGSGYRRSSLSARAELCRKVRNKYHIQILLGRLITN